MGLRHPKLGVVLLLLAVGASTLRADQPIFNEMPRWDDGWGIQFVEQYRHESDLMSGGEVIGPGLSEDVHLLHIEGVYTWDKSIRVTAKLPLVLDARRELLTDTGETLVQRDEGIGDVTVALPLKRYFNLDGRSGSWTFAPQIRIPLANKDEYHVYDGAWGQGLSAGYETETHRYIVAVATSAWFFGNDEPFQASASVDLGLNIRAFGTSGHLKWETDFIFEDDGMEKLYVGPKLYLRITDTVHFQTMFKKEIHSRRNQLDHGNGSFASLGFGFVY